MSNAPTDDSDYLDDLGLKHGDPLDSRTLNFPFDEVFARLDADEPEAAGRNYEALSFALRELLRWIVLSDAGGLNREQVSHRRALALLWLIRPDDFENSPSLSELARRLNIHKVALSLHSAEARRRFRIGNRFCSHAANFDPDQNQPLDPDHEHDSDTE